MGLDPDLKPEYNGLMQGTQDHPAYHIPSGQRVYAIGDIHGYPDALMRMEQAIEADLQAGAPGAVHIVYLGDYIDRGPDCRRVIDLLIEAAARGDGVERHFIEGNHERYLIDFLEVGDIPSVYQWLHWGGRQTLESYGAVLKEAVPLPSEIEAAREKLLKSMSQDHRAFLNGLLLTREMGDYLFVHAGIDPLKPLDQQTARDLQNIRKPFLNWEKPLAKKIVHGHTVEREPQNLTHRIGIDTGLYQGGKLTCAVLEGAAVRFLQVGGGD